MDRVDGGDDGGGMITHKFTTFNSEFFIYIGLKMNIFMCYYN